MDVGLHAGIAEGTDQDGVEVAGQRGKSIGRDGGLVAEVALGSPIEVGHFDCCARGFDHANCLWNDLFADAIARDYGDALLCSMVRLLFCVHGWNVNTIAIIEYRYGAYSTSGAE